MKNLILVLTLTLFLYLVPFLLCLEIDHSIAKSIEEIKAVSSSNSDMYIEEENLNKKISNIYNKNSNNLINNKEIKDIDIKEFDEIINYFEKISNIKSIFSSKSSEEYTMNNQKFNYQNSFSIKNLSNNKNKVSQSFDLYKMRIMKLRRKKEIIVKKVFEIFPLLGEILGLADVEKINLILNKFFIIRETDLLKKYITMWDTNINFTDQSAKVLLNLLLCNNRFNKLRCILNLLLEGLCKGDPRSIKIFKEIVITVIIDTIMKTKFKYFNDIQAKFNLIRLFNVGFVFPLMIKIQFLEKMLISEKLKELITFMIIKLKSKEDIDILININLHSPVQTLVNFKDINIKHNERILPKFLNIREKTIRAVSNENSKFEDNNIEEYYNLDNLTKENEIINENSNHNFSVNNNSENEDKDYLLSKADDFITYSDENLLSENDTNIEGNLNFFNNGNSNPGNNLNNYTKSDLHNQNTSNNKIKSSIKKIIPTSESTISLSQTNDLLFTDTRKSYENNSINNSDFTINKSLSGKDSIKILENIKLENDIKENESMVFDFKEKKNDNISKKYFSSQDFDHENFNYLETKLIEIDHLPYNEKQKVKLSEIKEQIKDEYNQMLYNMTYQPMPELEEYTSHYQVGINKRTIYPKYKKHLENLLKLNDLLEEFPISWPKGIIDVASPDVKEIVKPQNPVEITNNVNGVNVTMQFKEKEKTGNNNEKEKYNIGEIIKDTDFRFKSFMNSKNSIKKETKISLKTTNDNDFASKSFEQIANYGYKNKFNHNKINRGDHNIQNEDDWKNTNIISDDSLNNYNNIYNKDALDINENISYNMPEFKNIVKNSNENKNIKVIFPKEIHTSYEVNKQGSKTIEINKDSNFINYEKF